MSEDIVEIAPDATGAPVTKKKKGKKLLVLLAALVVLGGGIGGGLYATGMIGGAAHAADESRPRLVPKSEQKRGGSKEGEGGEGAAASGHKPPTGAGGDKFASNYYRLDKDFTSNLKESDRFIQVGVAVSTPYDDSVIENIQTNDIAVRSAVLMTLGDTSEEDIIDAAGKDRLAKRLTKAINATLQQKEGFGGVGNVYFTNFVVQ